MTTNALELLKEMHHRANLFRMESQHKPKLKRAACQLLGMLGGCIGSFRVLRPGKIAEAVDRFNGLVQSEEPFRQQLKGIG